MQRIWGYDFIGRFESLKSCVGIRYMSNRIGRYLPIVSWEAAPLSNTLRKGFLRQPGVALTVLITGETGTGKGMIARAIHQQSPERDRPFQVIDCTTVPDGMMESELFGHVRGAFTGAIADKPGLIELANGGSVFLDEIGELPLPLQAKLLRVLEECEVRPVGGTRVRRINTRFIAATNRNLEARVREGNFPGRICTIGSLSCRFGCLRSVNAAKISPYRTPFARQTGSIHG